MDGSKSEVSGAEHLSVQDNGETKSDFDKSQTSAIIGGFEADLDDLPPGYFKSRFFLGTFMAIGLGLWAGVGAFVRTSLAPEWQMARPCCTHIFLGLRGADSGDDQRGCRPRSPIHLDCARL